MRSEITEVSVVNTRGGSQPAPLGPGDASDLAACEQIIERGLKTFIEVGQALLTIRDRRLYRSTHDTFEDYCRERWRLGRSHAHRMIQAAEVASPIGDAGLPLPANEAQARELAPLRDQPELMTRAWRQAIDASGGKPTARMVSAVVNAIRQTARVEARGGLGVGHGKVEEICTGCAICQDPVVTCHYPPRRRPGPESVRVVYVDGHGVAYDSYEYAADVADLADIYAGAEVRQRTLPGGEQYVEVRQPPGNCGIRDCPACGKLGDSIEALFSSALDMLAQDAVVRATADQLHQVAIEWQHMLGELAYIERHRYYEAAGHSSLRDWLTATPGHLRKLQDIIREGPDLVGVTVPPELAEAVA